MIMPPITPATPFTIALVTRPATLSAVLVYLIVHHRRHRYEAQLMLQKPPTAHAPQHRSGVTL